MFTQLTCNGDTGQTDKKTGLKALLSMSHLRCRAKSDLSYIKHARVQTCKDICFRNFACHFLQGTLKKLLNIFKTTGHQLLT